MQNLLHLLHLRNNNNTPRLCAASTQLWLHHTQWVAENPQLAPPNKLAHHS